uniref:CCHC-type domain-containing protein n=1 Tax=Cannabis sativa TaxID=3483 RepID=A0A803Q4V0_CANSA
MPKNLELNLDECLRMHIELANSSENEALSDENQAIITLNSLYREAKTSIKYRRNYITLEEVISALNSMDLEMKNDKLESSNGELNLSHGGPNQRKPWKSIGKSHSRGPNRGGGHGKGKSKYRGLKDQNGCYHCGELGHYKRDSYFWKRNKNKSDGNETDTNQGNNYFTKKKKATRS